MFSTESPCPIGWFLHGKSCFLAIDIPTLEWNDARRICQKFGGELANITNAAENQFVLNLLISQAKTTINGAWLGLHRKADKSFYWTDGTPLSGYKAWNTNEPGASEGCTHIYGLGSISRGKWNDLSCSLLKGRILNAPVIVCQKKSN